MDTSIVLTGILKSQDELLIVKKNENDDLYPGAWEFPGVPLENGETIKEGLKRKLYEEIGFDLEFQLIITHYYDEIKNKKTDSWYRNRFYHNVNKSNIDIILSDEHCDYKWVTKDSELLDDFIKAKLENI